MLACTLLMSSGALVAMLNASAQTTVGLTVASSGFAINVRAKPEKRVPSTGNDSTLLTVEVRSIGVTTPLVSTTVNTGSGGTYSGITLLLTPGNYDVTAKGFSHLRRLKSSLALSSNVTVDFTDGGTYQLLSGDVNSTNGDNKVNGIDLSLIVAGLLGGDPRLDVNRDSRVNGIDLTNAVTNLNVTGDS